MPARRGVSGRRISRSGSARGAVGVVGPAESLVDRGESRDRIAELHRARVLRAAVAVFDERDYAHATVGHIVERARVSRRTFYDLFVGREECLEAILDDAVQRVEEELAAADLGALPWRERLRGGLWRVLCFLERESALGRVCVVQALRAEPVLSSRREGLLERLAAIVDGGRGEGPRGAECSALVAEGLVGAGFAIVHARLVRGERPSLSPLLGELMGMLVLPYLGPAAARRERDRGLPAPPLAPAHEARVEPERQAGDLLEGVPMRVTYRTVRVLEAAGELEGASNRTVAERAGIQDPGQVSKLLRRLEHLGLLQNAGAGAHTRGEPNAWTLTGKGRRVAQNIRLHDRSEAA